MKRFEKIKKDLNGSIEGLPLQLMIMGIIASLGTAVVVGWVSSIQTPVYIGMVHVEPNEIIVADGDGDGTYEGVQKTITIIVEDTAGNPVGNANVLIEGSSIDNEHHMAHGITDEDGTMTLSDVPFKIIGDRPSTIKISVSGQGIASEYWTELMVFPA